MITKDDRRNMIVAGEANGWLVSFGVEFDTLHFTSRQKTDGRARFVDIYFDRAGTVIREAWCDLGRMEPNVPYIVDYLEK